MGTLILILTFQQKSSRLNLDTHRVKILTGWSVKLSVSQSVRPPSGQTLPDISKHCQTLHRRPYGYDDDLEAVCAGLNGQLFMGHFLRTFRFGILPFGSIVDVPFALDNSRYFCYWWPPFFLLLTIVATISISVAIAIESNLSSTTLNWKKSDISDRLQKDAVLPPSDPAAVAARAKKTDRSGNVRLQSLTDGQAFSRALYKKVEGANFRVSLWKTVLPRTSVWSLTRVRSSWSLYFSLLFSLFLLIISSISTVQVDNGGCYF